MRRPDGTLRTDRPTVTDVTGRGAVDGAWGFHAIDGLPDVEESSGPSLRARRFMLPRSPDDDGPAGLNSRITYELARFRAQLEDRRAGSRRTLTVYELAVADALTARRDAGVRLATVLADDLAAYDGAMTGVLMGRAVDYLDPEVGGAARRTVSDAMAAFEAARHRLRLALVAVAVSNGYSTAQIGEAFAFSRQLASRYVIEAREEWPELRPSTSSRRRPTH